MKNNAFHEVFSELYDKQTKGYRLLLKIAISLVLLLDILTIINVTPILLKEDFSHSPLLISSIISTLILIYLLRKYNLQKKQWIESELEQLKSDIFRKKKQS